MLLNARGKEDPRSHWTTSQVSTISRYTRIPEHKIYFNFSGQDTYVSLAGARPRSFTAP